MTTNLPGSGCTRPISCQQGMGREQIQGGHKTYWYSPGLPGGQSFQQSGIITVASVLVAAILRTEEAPDSGTTPQQKLTEISLRAICFFSKFTLAPPAITSCKQTQPPILNEAVCV